MSTKFSSLPVVDVGILNTTEVSSEETIKLSRELYEVFATTGFAYLVNTGLGFDHEELFELSREFFALPHSEKMKLAKRSFRPGHSNTYRGYFPTQPHLDPNNLKEGFEIGNPAVNPEMHVVSTSEKIDLSEPNVWPDAAVFSKRERLETIYNELQRLGSKLLSSLAVPLGKDSSFVSSCLEDSLSTLRLLHYPPVAQSDPHQPEQVESDVRLSCPPHTDSGILTLLHQDTTGGLEVLNAAGDWIPVPYVPGSIVVNIGDLMARVSGSRFKATMHRVRAPPSNPTRRMGRFSIPFFFEPGENCVLSVEEDDGHVVYGEYVRKKMSTFVEFQEDGGYDQEM